MGVGCSSSFPEPAHAPSQTPQSSISEGPGPVRRWRGHELYDESPEGSAGSLSPTRQRLSEEIRAMYTSNQTEVLTIIHFNDVYNIESYEGMCGGAARFATVMKTYAKKNPLVLFSGDCLNPSIMSTFTKGEHMVPVLNALNVNTAVYGNHDFDFGVDELEDIVKETKFPWLLSNVIDDYTGQMLADGLVTRLITWQNKKIGIIGLVEEEWLVTLSTVDRENVTFLDYVERGQKLAEDLKSQGAEFVIALTHMRMPNDVRLAEHTSSIDLILGGHDHDYSSEKINGKYIVKSGSDFKSLSVITIELSPHSSSIFVQEVDIEEDVREDSKMQGIVDSYAAVMMKEMESQIGITEVDLDARFTSNRTQETNLGNLVTDIMLSVLDADIALLNSGTFRSDTIHPAGEFKKRDLLTLLPLVDPLMVIQVTGDQLYAALENGVSQYPKREGRFPQVSGMRYGFYPNAPAGQRVDPLTVVVDGECILPDKTYRLCIKEYLARGKDGYKVFCDCPVLVTAEEGPVLTTVVQNHFHTAGVVRGLKPSRSRHRQSLVKLRSKASLVKTSSLTEMEQARARLAPRVEGRIVKLGEGDEQEEEGWRDRLIEHRRLFMTGSRQEILEEWRRLNGIEEETNAAEITKNVLSNGPPHPSIYPHVIISEVSTDGSIDTDSKGSIASPSASVLSITDEDVTMETLHTAIRIDDVTTVSKFIKDKDGNLNLSLPYQETTVLHLAAKHNSVETIKYLLTVMKADPNIQDQREKKTALMWAAMLGNFDAAKILLEAGSNISVTDSFGHTATELIRPGVSDMKNLIENYAQNNNEVEAKSEK